MAKLMGQTRTLPTSAKVASVKRARLTPAKLARLTPVKRARVPAARQPVPVDLARGSVDGARAGLPSALTPDCCEVLDRGLEDALSMLHANRGNIQIFDPASGSLRIAVQTGFSDEFLEYFAVVGDDASACGRTARHLEQTVIPDVKTDARFAPHREIAAASHFRAVQSTPLIDPQGQLVGVLSTHYPRPYRPSDHDLQLMWRLGELMGEAIEACQEAC
jgi:GAF domain-containing protein